MKESIKKYDDDHSKIDKGYEWQINLVRDLEAEREELENNFQLKERELISLKENHEKTISKIESLKVDIQNKKKSLIVLDDNVYATKTRIKEKEIRYHEITKNLNDLKREISAKNENFKKYRQN